MNDISQITLTTSQQRVLDKMVDFLESQDKVFILKGYAGTGKTTMMRFLVQQLQKRNLGYHLLASTGRAAAVLNSHNDDCAQTIHSLIYRYQDFNQDISKVEAGQSVNGQLYLVFAPCRAEADSKNQVYIVDEASMIVDTEVRNITQAAFGTGRLLKELLEYDNDPGCKFVFVGDPCQLPPVSQVFSPALSSQYIRSTFECGVQEASLTEIIRQTGGNSIISASQRVRQLYASAPDSEIYYAGGKFWGRLPINNSANIHLHSNDDDLIRQYILAIKEHGFDYATFITRANSKCYQLSMEIRQRMGFTGIVKPGDLLLVAQNNGPTGLVNGDFVVVESVESETKSRAGLQFRAIRVRQLHSKESQNTLLLEDVLYGGRQNLDGEQQKGLFVDFILRMRKQGIHPKRNSELFNQTMLKDPYINALRCSFGYAVTCHKSQGGEWPEVFINMPRNIMFNPTKSSYQWVYTAMTRAKEHLHIVDDIYLESYRKYR